MRTVETDVLVIGAGPSGLMASLLLARYGTRAYTIAKHPSTAPEPRATITNQRTAEILREVGLEPNWHRIGMPLPAVGNSVIATSFSGPELYRYRCYGNGSFQAEYAAASPGVGFNAPQHLMERELLGALREAGGDVNFSHEVLHIDQDDHRVVATVRDSSSGQTYEVVARYAIGADGARSVVAEQIGIEYRGERALKYMTNLWIEADLEEYVAHRPAAIYVIVQPGGSSWVGSGMALATRKWDEWVLSYEYDPNKGEPDLSDEGVIRYARRLTGVPDLDVRVKATSKWQVNQLVATRYQSGRVFIVGDAAHRHAPSGGLGANTSMQDSWNLAWKLAYVIDGRAGEELLTSYDQERQPVGEQVVDNAFKLMGYQMPMIEALGVKPGQSSEEGWAVLKELAAATPEAAVRRAKLTQAMALQDYRSNALGVELGHRYSSVAVVEDGTPFPEHRRDEALYYEPTTHPGGYMPHAWLEHQGERVSTIDLVGHGSYRLIVGLDGNAWAAAAGVAAAELGIDLPVHAVGYRAEYDDVYGDWARLREFGDTGAILVRPDRVIAWRSLDLPEDPLVELTDALRRALARNDDPSGRVPGHAEAATR